MRLDPLFALMEDWADGKVMFDSSSTVGNQNLL